METNQGILQRAFELADSGIYANVSEVIFTLKREGFVDPGASFLGRATRSSIRDRCRQARGLRVTPRQRKSPAFRSRLDGL
jgi:hypothetical protein